MLVVELNEFEFSKDVNEVSGDLVGDRGLAGLGF